MKKGIIFIVVLLLFYTSAISESVVFEGIPRFKGVSMPTDSFSEKVEGENQRNSKLIITKEGDDYIWFSRGKNKMKHFKSEGNIHNFIRSGHSDFIKVSPLPKGEKISGMENMNYLYMESVSDGMKGVVTYWGYGEKLDL